MKKEIGKQRRGHRGGGHLFRRAGCKTWTIQFYKDKERIRERTGTRSRAIALEMLTTRIGEVHRNEFEERPKKAVTVQDLYDHLEAHVRARRPASVGELQRRYAHLKPVFSIANAASVTTEKVTSYILRRQTERCANANATINRELSTLKRMFNLARQSTPPKVKHTPHIPMLPENNVRCGFLESSEYDKLAAATQRYGVWLRTMFEVGYTYGWRKGELLNLRVRQVDMLANTIRLDVGTTKNGEGREITMNNTVRELLALCIATKRPDDYVFTRCTGQRVRDIRPAWKQACVAAGVPSLMFHDLRRSAVRNMVRAGVGDKVAMTISGHKTASIFRRYNIVDQNDIREALQKVERLKQLEREQTHKPRSSPYFSDPPISTGIAGIQ